MWTFELLQLTKDVVVGLLATIILLLTLLI